jgi:secondary thiamine-phosphate synthase enzyme
MQKISVRTSKRTELIDITGQIQNIVTKSNIKEGVCLVFCPHTTAGLTINENADPSVKSDIIKTLSRLIPEHADYAHAEGNSDSHVKSSLLGPSLSVLVEDGQLALGTWQGIFLCEADGPRSREVWVRVIRG